MPAGDRAGRASRALTRRFRLIGSWRWLGACTPESNAVVTGGASRHHHQTKTRRQATLAFARLIFWAMCETSFYVWSCGRREAVVSPYARHAGALWVARHPNLLPWRLCMILEPTSITYSSARSLSCLLPRTSERPLLQCDLIVTGQHLEHRSDRDLSLLLICRFRS